MSRQVLREVLGLQPGFSLQALDDRCSS